DLVSADDVIVLHDPQTAGLAWALQQAGAQVVWRCHVGIDSPNEHSERGWEFLRPYVEGVDGFVFSCERFAPAWVPRQHLGVIAPSIDPFSAKNEPMELATVVSVLQHVGLLAGAGDDAVGSFAKRDGSRGR